MRSIWKEKTLPKRINEIIFKYNNIERSKEYLQQEQLSQRLSNKKQKINLVQQPKFLRNVDTFDQSATLIKKSKLEKKEPIMLWKSDLLITNACLNIPFKLYTGKKIQKINISKDMINHKFGEFLFTRRLGKKKKAPQKKLKSS